MRAEPDRTETEPAEPPAPRWCLPAVVLAAVVGLSLMADTARSISATYDEVAYLRVAAQWWRTGRQDEITRMGSPLTFWKVQQAPVLWVLDRLGLPYADAPIAFQARLLPLVRVGSLWVWVVALGVTASWSRRLYGPRAMAFAAWLFALSPNLLAHGAIVTMELPLVACAAGVFLLFWRFLRTGRSLPFWASGAVAGLAFSCKFTAVLLPPLLALIWWLDLWRGRACKPSRAAGQVARGMTGFVALMMLSDVLVTGFAVLPMSRTAGAGHPSLDGRLGRRPSVAWLVNRAVETPIPQDVVGFLTQVHHQRSGGPSYLRGERRTTGWWYYYFVALAVKAPLAFWLLVGARAGLGRSAGGSGRGWVLPVTVAAFLAVTAAGSSRNYGLRYLLPMSPLAVVWVSALAEQRRGWPRAVAWFGIVGQAVAVGSVHPNELTFFNVLAGGPVGGRAVLSDSNLDWGQGLKALARLQNRRPELRDLTFYYFGDTQPRHYGVVGVCHVVDAVGSPPDPPLRFEASTRFVAVSASLQWGPWGPPGYFRALDGVRPVVLTDDTTIAVYRSADVFRPGRPGAPASIKVEAPREAFFQPIGGLGDPADEPGGVDAPGGVGGQVGDDDEVFLTAEDPDGEMALDGPRVELQEEAGVAVVGGPAHGDQREDRAVLGVAPRVAEVDRLAAVEVERHVHPPAVPRGGDLEVRALDHVAEHAGHVRVGRFRGLVGAEGVGPRIGVGRGGTERQPAGAAETGRRVIAHRAAGANDQAVGHGVAALPRFVGEDDTPGGRRPPGSPLSRAF